MRAPIGLKIRNLRKTIGISQSGLARDIGISPSYLNLIERNKRDVGGKLLQKIAAVLKVDLDQLTGENEQRLIQELEEAATDPVFSGDGLSLQDARELVAQFPRAADILTRLYRAYSDVNASLDAQANRLQSDPLFSQLLHQVLTQITTVRSGAEILEEVEDLSDEERRRFLTSISRGARSMSDVAQTLIRHFDQTSDVRRSILPSRELDDLIIQEKNYFPQLEDTATALREELAGTHPFGEAALTEKLAETFHVTVRRGGPPASNPNGFPSKYQFDPNAREIWFEGSSTAATRQFQLARLYCELAAPDIITEHTQRDILTTPAARRLARRAMGSYMAGALIFPYSQFLEDAEANAYDIDFLAQAYTASFEQVAHRLVTLRREGEEGIPFGFLRSDPAGRLTKQFPLSGLLLPNVGHACPLWVIYSAFRAPGQVMRQTVRFSDGSRFMFIAQAVAKRLSTYKDQPFYSSIMLICDVLHADRTVYGQGLDLDNQAADTPVGPSCRMCVRRSCIHRQEEALDPDTSDQTVRAPLVPQGFDLGGRG